MPSRTSSAEAGGLPFDYAVRRSARARRLSIRVLPGRVEVVLPRRMALQHAHEFVHAHAGWVQRKLAELERRRGESPSQDWPGSVSDGMLLPVMGRMVTVTLVGELHGTAPVRLRGGRLLLGTPAVVGDGDPARFLRGWLSEEVGRRAAHHAAAFALMLGVPFPRMRVRDMRTRWGSCGVRGTISLNWRLGIYPETVLEYTVLHEMCHLRVRDHGRAFWDLLGSLMPGYAGPRDLLRRQVTGA